MPKGVYDHKHDPWNKGKTYHLRVRGGGYYAVHKWLVKHWGKANHCEAINCKGKCKTHHWTLLEGKKYEHKKENFIQLCASCHRFYDQKPEWISKMAETKRGKKLTEEHRKALSLACKGINRGNKYSARLVAQYDKKGSLIRVWDCMNDAARELLISPSGITMCCRKQTNSAGGFIWQYRTT